MSILLVRRGQLTKDNKTGIPASHTADPAYILDSFVSYQPFLTLRAALELDLFTALASKKNWSAHSAAQALKVQTQPLQRLLDALSVLGYLTKRGLDSYTLTTTAQTYLVKNKPSYLGHFLLSTEKMREKWMRLPEAIRQGHLSDDSLNQQEKAVHFFPLLVRCLYYVHEKQGRTLARKLGVGRTLKGVCILDVAAGSGVWSLMMAQADPTAEVTANDYPEMLDVVREFAESLGLSARVHVLPGNLREVDYGKNRFDVAILGHICHSEGAAWSQRLFKKVARSLKSGGRIVILDFLPNENRTGPAQPILFALNMLVNTDEGGTFTLKEYSQWLTRAGFHKIKTLEIGGASPALVATKR